MVYSGGEDFLDFATTMERRAKVILTVLLLRNLIRLKLGQTLQNVTPIWYFMTALHDCMGVTLWP
jgi:hypothetical protein